jgi:hypothetical protein
MHAGGPASGALRGSGANRDQAVWLSLFVAFGFWLISYKNTYLGAFMTYKPKAKFKPDQTV